MNRKKPSPAQFYRTALTAPDEALDLLTSCTHDDRLEMLAALLWHTVRALSGGKPPGRLRRQMTLWRFYAFFENPAYRDDIAALMDSPFNPDRLTDASAGQHIPKLMVMMSALTVNWLDWSEEDIEAHVATIVKHTQVTGGA